MWNMVIIEREKEWEREGGTKTHNMNNDEVFKYILIAYYHASAWMRPVLGFILSLQIGHRLIQVVQVCEHSSWQEFRGPCWL